MKAGSASGGAHRGHSQVLDKGVELLGHAAVTVQKIQHLIKKNQNRAPGNLVYSGDGLRAWWDCFGSRT